MLPSAGTCLIPRQTHNLAPQAGPFLPVTRCVNQGSESVAVPGEQAGPQPSSPLPAVLRGSFQGVGKVTLGPFTGFHVRDEDGPFTVHGGTAYFPAGHSGAFQRCEVPCLQMLIRLAIQIAPWASAPEALASSRAQPVGTPWAYLVSPAMKGCRVTGQKLDSCVYSPNTERALQVLPPHPDPLNVRGTGVTDCSQAAHTHLWRLATRRSIRAGPAARESLVRHKEELSDTAGAFNTEREGKQLQFW